MIAQQQGRTSAIRPEGEPPVDDTDARLRAQTQHAAFAGVPCSRIDLPCQAGTLEELGRRLQTKSAEQMQSLIARPKSVWA